MKDQAERLRELMRERIKSEQGYTTNNKAKVLAVTSGKGGVGKTNFAINLAISIKRLGYRVIVFDADFGLANVEILTGTDIKYTIADLIVNEKSIFEIISNGPEGIKLISGGTGFQELSTMSRDNINKLLIEIEKLESITDFIIIDTGAGISNTVLDLAMAADEVILITTPDPTSVMDGYTVIKALNINGYRGRLNVVTNIVGNRREALSTFNRLNTACNSFLKLDLNFLGYLERSNIINKAVKNQVPFLLSNPSSSVSKKINIMALKFIDNKKCDHLSKNLSFAQKLKALLLGKDDIPYDQ